MAEPRRKKRRVEDTTGFSVKVGGKIISLDGYLNAPSSSTKQNGDRPGLESRSEEAQGAEEETHTPKNIAAATTKKASSQPARTNQPRKPSARGDPTLLKTRKLLPIWSSQEDIRAALARDNVLILVGETGSGKSTQVPQFLLDEGWCRGTIAVTQPRRVAATTLAHRVSQEVGTPLGKGPKGLVGYSVRFDHNVPRGTRIKFLTEGMLLQELLNDPGLKHYSAVIIDEVHERSVDVDLLLGFLKQILADVEGRRDGVALKVVVMSATANIEKIQSFFSGDEGSNADQHDSADATSRLLQIPGRQYPVNIVHSPAAVPDLQEALVSTIFKIHQQEPLPGDILAFLTGQEEIESAQKLIEEYEASLASNVPKVKVLPLFGQLSIEAQHRAFQPIGAAFTRKIILATNIAETSVTVPGIRYVVDCGKAKVKQWIPSLSMESLLAKPISKSSAIQRTGRAGREGPGKCYRLYPELEYKKLAEIDRPEILRTDVLGAVLTMKARGVQDVFTFPLMDAPPANILIKAHEELWRLGALNANDGSITELGRQMSRFPVSVPYARVLLAAADPQHDCLLDVIDIIASLTAGDDIFLQLRSEEAREEAEEYRNELYSREGDLLTYLTTMKRYAAEMTDRKEWCQRRRINTRTMKQALNIRRQLRGMCLKHKLLKEAPVPDPQPFVPPSPEDAETLIRCFLAGFMLKTAYLEMDGSYTTSEGKHVVAIHPASVLHGAKKREAIMFLENVFTQKNYVKKVSAVQANWITEALESAVCA